MPRLDRHTPDPVLLRAYRAGDISAWDLLVERYEALVCAIPRRMGLAAGDTEDVAQTVFIALLNHLDQLREETRLAAWLVTTAKREAWHLVQRQRTRRERELGEAPLETVPESAEAALPEESLLALEEQHFVRQAIAQLPDRCRELLTLLYLEEPPLAYAQVVERLGIPLGSIGPQRARCLERVKKHLIDLGY